LLAVELSAPALRKLELFIILMGPFLKEFSMFLEELLFVCD
jgi:hypothetical protein